MITLFNKTYIHLKFFNVHNFQNIYFNNTSFYKIKKKDPTFVPKNLNSVLYQDENNFNLLKTFVNSYF